MGLKFNSDGSLRAFTPEEVDALEIETRGVRDGSHPTHVRGVNSSTIRQAYFCDFDMFEDAVAYWLGGAVTWIDSTFTRRLSRIMPQRFPGLPNFAFTKIESATGHKFIEDDDDGVPRYEKMEVVLTAEHLPFDLAEDEDTGSETFRYWQRLPSQNSADYLTMPGGVQHYLRPDGVGAGNPRPHKIPIPYSIGFTTPKSIIRRKWNRVPATAYYPGSGLFKRIWGDPVTGARPWVGAVNSNVFENYERWTLLFLGAEEEYDRDQLGDRFCWNLTYSWLYDPNGHLNKYYFETDPAVMAGNYNGWYFTGKGDLWYNQNDIVPLPDDYSLHPERNMYGLVSVAD